MKWPDFHVGDALLIGGCGVVGLFWGLFATGNAFLQERAYPHLTLGGVVSAIVYGPTWLALGIQHLLGHYDIRVTYALAAVAGAIVGALIGSAIVYQYTRPPR